MKKKILFIITQSEFGGAQRFLSTLAPKLDPDLYEILVATGSTGDRHFTDHLKNLKIPNVTLERLVRNPDPIRDIRAIFEIRKLLTTFRPDTVFLLSTKAGFLGSIAARNHKVKVIYRIGGWAFNDPQHTIRKWMIIFAEKITARWKDIIILNNRRDLAQAEQYHIRPRKSVELVHNGIDVYKMKFMPREDARKKLTATAPLVVGTIANFYPSKGLKYFVEAARAFQQNKNISFVIVGDGMYRPPEASNVILAGRIPEASRILSAFDIFVSPSVKEGFQWAVLEAMSAKVPVIATTVGATPEIISDGKNGFLVEPGKPERIVDCLHKLIDNERLRQEFGIQGHQTVLHSFDIETMVSEVEKIL